MCSLPPASTGTPPMSRCSGTATMSSSITGRTTSPMWGGWSAHWRASAARTWCRITLGFRRPRVELRHPPRTSRPAHRRLRRSAICSLASSSMSRQPSHRRPPRRSTRQSSASRVPLPMCRRCAGFRSSRLDSAPMDVSPMVPIWRPHINSVASTVLSLSHLRVRISATLTVVNLSLALKF